MPLTFLAHQAPVLPLARRLDATALVIGSMAPDLFFVVGGTRLEIDAHTWAAQVWACLPLTSALLWVIRRRVGWLAVPSALVGSLSHVGLDGFTHGFGWAVDVWPALARVWFELPSGREVHVYDALQVGLSGAGVVATVAMVRAWWSAETAAWLGRVRSRTGVIAVLAAAVVTAATFHIGGAQHVIVRAVVAFAAVVFVLA